MGRGREEYKGDSQVDIACETCHRQNCKARSRHYDIASRNGGIHILGVFHKRYRRTPSPESTSHCLPSSFHKHMAYQSRTGREGMEMGLRGKNAGSWGVRMPEADENRDNYS